MSTITLTEGEPISMPSPAHAMILAPFCFSDRERNTVAVQYLNAVAAVGRVADLDVHDDTLDREKVRLVIGECLTVLLDIALRTKNGDAVWAVIPQGRWCSRGSDCTALQCRSSMYRLLATASILAAKTRDRLMVPQPAERLTPISAKSRSARDKAVADTRNEEHAMEHLMCETACSLIWTDTGAPTLYHVAAYWKLSLRECFEAFANTRRSKLLKTSKKYCS